MRVRHHHQCSLFIFINTHFFNRGRIQRFADQHAQIRGPRDNINFFAFEFPHNRLDTGPLNAHTGTDGIHGFIFGDHRDLGAIPRLAHDTSNLDNFFHDLGYFQFKQFHHKLGMRTGQNHLHVLGCATDFQQQRSNTIAPVMDFAWNLLVNGQDGFSFSNFHQIIASILPHDDTVNQFILALRIVSLDSLPGRFPNLLENHLFGSLRGNSSEVFQFNERPDLIAQFGIRVHASRLIQ